MDGGRARPIVHDFDVSGMVTGRHPWFKDVFSEQFSAAHSQADVEVMAQLQRTRTLFPRGVLDAARAAFLEHKDGAYRTLEAARSIRPDAITRNAISMRFSRRSAPTRRSTGRLLRRTARPCIRPGGSPLRSSGPIPVGTPVSEPLQKDGDMIQVRLLDALWHWAPPVKCAAAHQGPVWIKAAVVSRDYPAR